MMQSTPRYAASDLLDFARRLLAAAGMPEDKAQGVAGILVEGDLLGHTTHGLQLLPSYLREVESGSMRVDGGPEVIRETPATLTWNGRRLPGPGHTGWLHRPHGPRRSARRRAPMSTSTASTSTERPGAP